MKVHLSRRYGFSASHRLHSPELSEEENRRVYGKCNNPYGHGHNYRLTVTLAGEPEAKTGMICDLAAVDAAVNRLILQHFDHANLNSLPEFVKLVPTTENLAAVADSILRRELSLPHLVSIRLDETNHNSVEYAGGAQ
jgi:6-pyruvoyltetrahydropterin/6-carboxytetrahydropterin synthase